MILSGKDLVVQLKEELNVIFLEKKIGESKPINIVVIHTLKDEASQAYKNTRDKLMGNYNIQVQDIYLDNLPNRELLNYLQNLNQDPYVAGIMINRPVGKGVDYNELITTLGKKDIEGVGLINTALLTISKKGLIPPTSNAVIYILDKYNIDLSGKNVLLIGRSHNVGKPLIPLLLERNATLTIAHSKTQNISSLIANADVVISAVGKPNFVKESHSKQILIDVGFHYLSDGTIVGDISKEAKERALSYTPVPNGVGSLTTYLLIKNILENV
ncbi:MAG: bifunctional 5,10-methylenetetrahydrofolate dehydrogenase/5,10-methenyltetrahydrofolate cyclohydrolase [Bacillales bacterium]|jgi:methylenetetrahydrofolate dehydrogenase (NADP+)/methenyltetrahydrofolate cyclohydrolase|nr:bifunctional 5,10-methylenetetrahydrofolate dehydrogenase/5,10-methenyltetrahydrofolate cyclohydrolase [Bacillales bacterium]